MSFRAAAPAFAKKTTKTPPPDDTGMESSYLKALGEKQTPVTVKLVCGEALHGWIEYYDVGMVRLTREGSPNLFIFKHEIMYIAEDTGRRARCCPPKKTTSIPCRNWPARPVLCSCHFSAKFPLNTKATPIW
jgi:host factor-I protein